MEFLREVLAGVRRLDEPEDDQDDIDVVDLDAELDVNGDGEIDLDDLSDLGLDDPDADEFEPDSEVDAQTDPDIGDAVFDGADLSTDGSSSTGDAEPVDDQLDSEADDVAQTAVEDPDKRGLIRVVKNAHLVYKREGEDGTFEELWVYNITNMRDEQATKRAILAGTDIPVNKTRSEDGSQTYELWASGNAEMLHITGLPS